MKWGPCGPRCPHIHVWGFVQAVGWSASVPFHRPLPQASSDSFTGRSQGSKGAGRAPSLRPPITAFLLQFYERELRGQSCVKGMKILTLSPDCGSHNAAIQRRRHIEIGGISACFWQFTLRLQNAHNFLSINVNSPNLRILKSLLPLRPHPGLKSPSCCVRSGRVGPRLLRLGWNGPFL